MQKQYVSNKPGWGANAEYRYGENGRKGDLGELFVEKYCKDAGIPFEGKQDRHSQVVLKIDCIIEGTTVDVKTNAYKDYLCVEICKNTGKDGWIFTTTAKEIYGVDLDKKEIYRYKVEDMLEYVGDNLYKQKPNKFGDTIMWVRKDLDFIERLH